MTEAVMDREERLCLLAELNATGAKSISRESDKDGLLLVLVGDGVRAYISHCPHLGVPLETIPDHVLDESREFLVCSTHGARFTVEDGLCVRGPCRDQSLEQVAVTVKDGAVYLAD